MLSRFQLATPALISLVGGAFVFVWRLSRPEDPWNKAPAKARLQIAAILSIPAMGLMGTVFIFFTSEYTASDSQVSVWTGPKSGLYSDITVSYVKQTYWPRGRSSLGDDPLWTKCHAQIELKKSDGQAARVSLDLPAPKSHRAAADAPTGESPRLSVGFLRSFFTEAGLSAQDEKLQQEIATVTAGLQTLADAGSLYTDPSHGETFSHFKTAPLTISIRYTWPGIAIAVGAGLAAWLLTFSGYLYWRKHNQPLDPLNSTNVA